MSKGVLPANCYATKWLFCQQLNGDYKNEKFNKSIKLANTLGAEKTRSRVRLWSKLAWPYRIPGHNIMISILNVNTLQRGMILRKKPEKYKQ